MIEPGRLSSLLAQRELSQSELARRVGVSQATIFRLVSGTGYGSKHIHKIARELHTTPAYLAGETDDPSGELPTPVPISSDAREMIDHFESLSPADRRALLQIARSMATGGAQPSETVHARGGEGSAATVHDKSAGYRGEPE